MNDSNIPSVGVPMDTAGLQEMLNSGPSISEEPLEGPSPFESQPQEQKVSEVSQAESTPVLPGDGPDEAAKSQMILPTEKEKALLKKKYPGVDLKVVPVPYSGTDGKMQCYVVRSLSFAQWRSCETTAAKVSESKPGIPAEEILAEKVVASALVWPNIPEQELMVQKAGLVPTLYGVIQQLCLFFNPDAIARLTFTL